MRKISWAIVTFAALLSLPAGAGEARNSTFTPRQMAHCVMHRVKDAPSESYKIAMKICKSEFDADAAASRDDGGQTAMNNAGTGKAAK